MPLVALTDGMASGKCAIAGRLAEHGAAVVDADAVVRELQQPGEPVLGAIAQPFGEEVCCRQTGRSTARRSARSSSPTATPADG